MQDPYNIMTDKLLFARCLITTDESVFTIQSLVPSLTYDL